MSKAFKLDYSVYLDGREIARKGETVTTERLGVLVGNHLVSMRRATYVNVAPEAKPDAPASSKPEGSKGNKSDKPPADSKPEGSDESKKSEGEG